MDEIQKTSKEEAIRQVEAAVKHFWGLSVCNESIRRSTIISDSTAKSGSLDNPEDTLANDLAIKMDKILNAESIRDYLLAYKNHHLTLEAKNEKIVFQTEAIVPNPRGAYFPQLEFFVGGIDYPAFLNPIPSVPKNERNGARSVQYSIFLEYSALSALLDMCIKIDIEMAFSKNRFFQTILEIDNLKTAVRVNRAFINTKIARVRIAGKMNHEQRSGFYKAVKDTEDDQDRKIMTYLQIHRVFLLIRMIEPEIFRSKVLKSADYHGILGKHLSEIPSENHISQILGKYLSR